MEHANSDSLLRQIVPHLCGLAQACRPELAATLSALASAATAQGSESDVALEKALADLSKASAGQAVARTVTSSGPEDVSLMQGILQTLTIPLSLEPLARDVRQALPRANDAASRQRLANQTLHLLAEAKAHGEQRHKELQEFLKTTVSRLVQLENAVTQAQVANQNGVGETALARQETEVQCLHLRAAFTETDDIAQLRTFIGDRLDNLQSHLRAQDVATDATQSRLEATLNALSQQVAQLNAETVTLRSRLDVTSEEALRDPLTGAYNRLAYDRRAALEVARWRSDGGELSLIVCDIDHFKRVNDSFGHAAGDKVLKEVVRLLQEQLRSSDFVARYGGEEFVILLNGAAEEHAMQIAEKLRRTVKAAPFRSRGERVPVTISCGIGTFRADDTLDKVFERTDAALYAAKAQGRDRCVPAVAKVA